MLQKVTGLWQSAEAHELAKNCKDVTEAHVLRVFGISTSFSLFTGNTVTIDSSSTLKDKQKAQALYDALIVCRDAINSDNSIALEILDNPVRAAARFATEYADANGKLGEALSNLGQLPLKNNILFLVTHRSNDRKFKTEFPGHAQTLIRALIKSGVQYTKAPVTRTTTGDDQEMM